MADCHCNRCHCKRGYLYIHIIVLRTYVFARIRFCKSIPVDCASFWKTHEEKLRCLLPFVLTHSSWKASPTPLDPCLKEVVFKYSNTKYYRVLTKKMKLDLNLRELSGLSPKSLAKISKESVVMEPSGHWIIGITSPWWMKAEKEMNPCLTLLYFLKIATTCLTYEITFHI